MFLSKKVNLEYYRFQFRCGCEILTAALDVEDVQNHSVKCVFHNEESYSLFGLEKDRYWRLLLASEVPTFAARTIPPSRGTRPQDRYQSFNAEEVQKNRAKHIERGLIEAGRSAQQDGYRAAFEAIEDPAA